MAAFVPSAPATLRAPSSSTFLRPLFAPTAVPAAARPARGPASAPVAVAATPVKVPTQLACPPTVVVEEGEREERMAHAKGLKMLPISDVDIQWLHVLSEGWAFPLMGFMNEDEYLMSQHFNVLRGKDGKLHNQSVPIVLHASDEEKEKLEACEEIALTEQTTGKILAILKNPHFYAHNKEERVSRTFGLADERHPYAEIVYASGDWLVGGDIEVLEPIRYDDGLDKYRLSPQQLYAKYEELGADCVFFFQLRNPIHNGHALLMTSCREQLIEMGFKNPVLVVHQIGGKVKGDDVPLQQRIEQNEAVLEEGILDPKSTILGIFPSPMLYAGPTEVQWHAKARMNAGCQYYIVGRDPAGMKHPDGSKDLYDAWHGKKVLQMAPGLEELEILPFRVAAYDKTKGAMAFFEPERADDFLFISGTKMRGYAKSGEQPPDGFMGKKAWNVLVEYYAGLK